jgi:hypothetical protein
MKKIVIFTGAGVPQLVNNLMLQAIGDDKNDK